MLTRLRLQLAHLEAPWVDCFLLSASPVVSYVCMSFFCIVSRLVAFAGSWIQCMHTQVLFSDARMHACIHPCACTRTLFFTHNTLHTHFIHAHAHAYALAYTQYEKKMQTHARIHNAHIHNCSTQRHNYNLSRNLVVLYS